MGSKIADAMENHPVSGGYLGTFVTAFMSGLGWLLQHAGDIGAFFGMLAALLAFSTGCFTFLIQYRRFRRGARNAANNPNTRKKIGRHGERWGPP